MEETMLGYKVLTKAEYDMVVSGKKELDRVAEGKFYETIKDAILYYEKNNGYYYRDSISYLNEQMGEETIPKVIVRIKAMGNIKNKNNNIVGNSSSGVSYSSFKADKISILGIVPIDKLITEYLKNPSEGLLFILFNSEEFTSDLFKYILTKMEFLENVNIISTEIYKKNPIINSEILEIIVQKKIGKESNSGLYVKIARSPFINIKTIFYLIKNFSNEDLIISSIIKNPATPSEILIAILSSETSRYKTRNYIEEIISSEFRYSESGIKVLEVILDQFYLNDYAYSIVGIIEKLPNKKDFTKIFELIIKNTGSNSLLSTILKIQNLDKNILKLILKKINPSSEKQIAELGNDFFSSTEGIKTILEVNSSPAILKWAAKSKNSDEEIFKMILACTSDEEILVEIARNNSANEEILKIILNKTNEYYIFQAMIKNPYLTEELLIVIFSRVDYCEFEVLISNLEFSYEKITSLLDKMKSKFYNNIDNFRKILFIKKQIIKFRINLQSECDLGYDYKEKYLKFLNLYLNVKNSEIESLIESEIKELEEIGALLFESDSSITINSYNEDIFTKDEVEELTPESVSNKVQEPVKRGLFKKGLFNR